MPVEPLVCMLVVQVFSLLWQLGSVQTKHHFIHYYGMQGWKLSCFWLYNRIWLETNIWMNNREIWTTGTKWLTHFKIPTPLFCYGIWLSGKCVTSNETMVNWKAANLSSPKRISRPFFPNRAILFLMRYANTELLRSRYVFALDFVTFETEISSSVESNKTRIRTGSRYWEEL